jgi:hypothetical protein
MRPLVRALDALLRWAQGVEAFDEDERCILRIQLAHASRPLNFPNGMVKRGEPVILLHLWNERIPPMPPQGADVEWAARMKRLFIHSLRALAQAMRREARLGKARAIGGATVLVASADGSDGSRLVQQLGFTILPYSHRLGRFAEFWENLYSWWLMWTYNPATLRRRKFLHLRRAEIWMPTEEFLRRYGSAET